MLRDLFFGAVILGLLALPDSAPAQGQFVLELEGSKGMSPLQSMTTQGGHELRVGLGLAGDPVLLEWIEGSFANVERRHFAVHALDARGNVTASQSFIDAYVIEVALPAFDASSKEAGSIAVRFDASEIRYQKGSGKPAASFASGATRWNVGNFRVELGGLPCEHVVKIASIGWKREPREPERRFGVEHEGKVDVSEVALTLDVRDLDAWSEWVKEHQVGGRVKSVEGVIEILSPDLGKTLGSVRLEGVVPVGLKVGDLEANKAGVPTFEVELSVESVELDLTP